MAAPAAHATAAEPYLRHPGSCQGGFLRGTAANLSRHWSGANRPPHQHPGFGSNSHLDKPKVCCAMSAGDNDVLCTMYFAHALQLASAARLASAVCGLRHGAGLFGRCKSGTTVRRCCVQR